jgi:tetratricopeptide (TPR) repeat protein
MHRRVVALAPKYADAHNNLATVLSKQERWDEALDECRIAVELAPAAAEFHFNLGNALSAAEDWSEAAAEFQRATDLAPGNADAHANLGIALYHLEQPEQAVMAHRVATGLQPDSAQNWANLAAAQVDMDDSDGALESCRRALELDPDLPEAHNSVGLALNAKSLWEDAIAAYETAIRLRPHYHKAYNNLGGLLHAQGRFSEALAAYTNATALVSDYAEAQCNKGMLHLLLGEFEPGWRGYEHGLDMKRTRAHVPFRQFEMWKGEATSGKTIAVWDEQGIGDQIMFASVLPDLVECGTNCLLRIDGRLHPLLQRSMSSVTLLSRDLALSRIEELAVDYQAPIGSLCRWLRPNLASFPSRAGYLKADSIQVDLLRDRYRNRFGGRPLVGISWQGGTGTSVRVRSIPLAAWAPILAQPAFGFVNLQYGDCRADLEAVRRDLGVEILHDESVDPLKNLDDFAAQTAAMDLVISIDNSTVHMAGALNVPVWVMLPAVPDWRWMLDRSDSPWYPSVRLFRQALAGEWTPVIARVAKELKHRFGVADRAPTAGAWPEFDAPR